MYDYQRVRGWRELMSQERNDDRSRVIAVAGAKGGVGKTTTAINLAAQLADAGYRTVVLDLDLVMANVLDFLDLDLDESADATAHEVLADEATLAEATYEAPGGMDVVPSGPSLEGYVKTDLGNMALTIERLKQNYDYVIIDTGAGVSRQNVEPLGGADEVVLVSTPRIAAVRDARKTIKLVDRSGGSVRGLVLTKSGTGRSPGPERISEFLGVPLLAHVEEDDAIPDSQDRGVPVVVSAPDSPAARAYGDLASALISAHESGTSPSARPFEAEADIQSLTAEPSADREGDDAGEEEKEEKEEGDGGEADSGFEFLEPDAADEPGDEESHEGDDESDVGTLDLTNPSEAETTESAASDAGEQGSGGRSGQESEDGDTAEFTFGESAEPHGRGEGGEIGEEEFGEGGDTGGEPGTRGEREAIAKGARNHQEDGATPPQVEKAVRHEQESAGPGGEKQQVPDSADDEQETSDSADDEQEASDSADDEQKASDSADEEQEETEPESGIVNRVLSYLGSSD